MGFIETEQDEHALWYISPKERTKEDKIKINTQIMQRMREQPLISKGDL